MTAAISLDDDVFDASTPQVKAETHVRQYEGESVVWAPAATTPVHLDPVAAIVHQLLDGQVTMAELAEDVHAAMGVPLAVARSQLRRVVTLLTNANVLVGSSDVPTSGAYDFDLFVAPPNP